MAAVEVRQANMHPQKPNAEAAIELDRMAVLYPVLPGSNRHANMQFAICSGVSQWCKVMISCSSSACELALPPIPNMLTCIKLKNK